MEEITIAPKFKMGQEVFTMIGERIYRIIIERYECVKIEDKLREIVFLTRIGRPRYEITEKSIEDIFHTKEDLVEEHVRRLKAQLTS